MFAFSEREIILKDNGMEPESWRFRIFFSQREENSHWSLKNNSIALLNIISPIEFLENILLEF